MPAARARGHDARTGPVARRVRRWPGLSQACGGDPAELQGRRQLAARSGESGGVDIEYVVAPVSGQHARWTRRARAGCQPVHRSRRGGVSRGIGDCAGEHCRAVSDRDGGGVRRAHRHRYGRDPGRGRNLIDRQDGEYRCLQQRERQRFGIVGTRSMGRDPTPDRVGQGQRAGQ
ncbi:hypothetical protein D3C86_1513780 [compost metagenome]